MRGADWRACGEGPRWAYGRPRIAKLASLVSTGRTGPLLTLSVVGFKNSGWITSHGMALNVTKEPLPYFGHIVPCGDPWGQVTSLGTELPLATDAGGECGPAALLMGEAEAHLLEAFSDIFQCDWSGEQAC